MHNPHRFLIRMIAFVVVSAGLASLLYTTLEEAFRANPALNGLITGVLLIGIAYRCGRFWRSFLRSVGLSGTRPA